MKVAVLESGELRIRDVAVPVPAGGQALLRVRAAGLCHSDLSLVRHEDDDYPLDVPLGHEAIGIVEGLGPGADRFVNIGERVIVAAGCAGWCGACRECLQGLTSHCTQNRSALGFFSELIAVDARSLVTVPDNVGDLDAPLACGGLTAYGAVKKLLKHGVHPGQTIAVLGAAGGLGHYAVQIATHFGYRVVAVDIGDDRLDFARSLGAAMAVEPQAAVDSVKEQGGGVRGSLVFPGSMAAHDLGWRLLGLGGVFVSVGLVPRREGKFAVDLAELRRNNATIASSVAGNVQDMREVVALASAGRVKTHVSRTGPLSDLGAMFDELATNQVVGRAVVEDLAG